MCGPIPDYHQEWGPFNQESVSHSLMIKEVHIMNNFPSEVKQTLDNIINDMANVAWLYSTRPGHAFTRTGKLGFAKTMELVIAMEGGTLSDEIMEYFNYDLNSPTPSAFVQQRSMLKLEAFQYLFKEFTNHYHSPKYKNGYSILAADGTKVVYATNPANVDDYVKPDKEGERGYNHLHLNAFYDIVTGCYVDAIIQHGIRQDEREALHTMIDNYDAPDPLHTIITVDRGYESFDLIGHMLDKNLRFVMRVKDYTVFSSLLTNLTDSFPDRDEFDVNIKRFVTRSRSKIKQSLDPSIYLYIRPQKNFRSLPPESNDLYYMNIRVTRIKLSDGSYECLVSNLPMSEFTAEELKDIYHARWKIETSFRYLKYAVGMTNFHSRKLEFVKQEIFAKLTLYNFSAFITNQASASKCKKKGNKHNYKINFSMAAKICHRFLKNTNTSSVIDVIAWIERNLSVDKAEERHFVRNLRGIGACSFLYRVA